MTMSNDKWKRILSTVNEEGNLSKDNVIEKIREKLSRDSDEYTQLSETGFDASLTCLNIEYTSSCIEPGFFGLPSIRNQVEIHHRTLFILAAITGHVKIVEALIERGIDINTVDKDGLTPLHEAAGSGHVEVVNALIKKGANVKAVDKYGNTPLHLAASHYSDEGIVKALIENGADVNAKNQDRCTPLHYAALSSNNKEIVEILVKEGADVNASLDESMITPLHMAARGHNANQEVVQALIEKGANVKAVSKDGLTPLHIAASCGLSGEIVKTLIKGKANIDAVDKCGRTPLHFATDCFSSTDIEILIENGADYSLKNKNGKAQWILTKADI
ncbi:MAG: ankyrin repeat domain-containing protein [Wolbachia endosymbiont of Nomada marshamella]|nr:ankyrin repeat domain-containing protein [Wolbachia endosymbiont of Nomada marshamella]